MLEHYLRASLFKGSPPEKTSAVVRPDPLPGSKTGYIDKKYKYRRGGYVDRGNYSRTFAHILNNYEPEIEATAKKFGKTAAQQRQLKLFLVGTMARESNGRLTNRRGKPLISSAGAVGLMQFLPRTALSMRRYLKMDEEQFNTKWAAATAGSPKSVGFQLDLAAAYYGRLEKQAQKRYKNYHPNKILKGEELLNAVHILYSHRQNTPFMRNLFKVGDFTPEGIAHGSAAPGYTSVAHQMRSYYGDYLDRKGTRKEPVKEPVKESVVKESAKKRVVEEPVVKKRVVKEPVKEPVKESVKKPVVEESVKKPVVEEPVVEESVVKEPVKRKKAKEGRTGRYWIEGYPASLHEKRDPKESFFQEPRAPLKRRFKAEQYRPVEQSQVAAAPPAQPPAQPPAHIVRAGQRRPSIPVSSQKYPSQSISTQGERLMVSLGGVFELDDRLDIDNLLLFKSTFRVEEYKEIS